MPRLLYDIVVDTLFRMGNCIVQQHGRIDIGDQGDWRSPGPGAAGRFGMENDGAICLVLGIYREKKIIPSDSSSHVITRLHVHLTRGIGGPFQSFDGIDKFFKAGRP